MIALFDPALVLFGAAALIFATIEVIVLAIVFAGLIGMAVVSVFILLFEASHDAGYRFGLWMTGTVDRRTR